MAHLLLEILVDPYPGIDRSRTDGAGAEFAAIVLHPRPPRSVDVGRRQPDVGRLVEDFPRHLLQHGLTLGFILLLIDHIHLLVVFGIVPLGWIPDLAADEALADGGRRIG